MMASGPVGSFDGSGHHARLETGDGYFYFWSEDAADWIDRTVRVATLNALTLDQWVGEYLRLKNVNAG